MKNAKWNRRNQISAAAVSLTSAFTALFFPAAESFFLNPVDFGISAQPAILPLLLTALGIAAGIWLLLNLCLLMHEKLFHAVLCLLFGFSIAFYIQLLCYNGEMDRLDNAHHISPSQTFVTVNGIVMLTLALLPFFCFLLKQVRPVVRFAEHIKLHFIPIVSGLFLVMQLAGLSSAVWKYQSSGIGNTGTEQYYASYEPLTSLSKEHNIVVFVVDRMDGTFIDDLNLQYPDLADSLEGFTAYRNNISCYTLTFPSVPEMLTGIQYQRESWLDYTDKLWAGNHNVMQQIHDAGYQVNLIGDASVLYSDPRQILSCVDNLRPASAGKVFEYNYGGEDGILPTEIRYSLYRVLPYFLKPFCMPLSTDSFTDITEAADDCQPASLSSNSDVKYHSYMEAHPLNADNGKNTFTFVHLYGAHGKNEAVQALAGGSDTPAAGLNNAFAEVQEVRGNFTTIGHYLDQMKQLGIYDCSDIIILGDHGQQLLDTDTLTPDGRLNADIHAGFSTALLIKPANAPHEKMVIDRQTEMSNAYFSASMLEYAGLDHSAYGISFSEAAAGAPHADRIHHVLEYMSAYHAPELLYTFSISGDTNDFSNWTCLTGPEQNAPSEP